MTAAIRCKHRLPSPEVAGAQTWDMLKKWAAQSPHLRPCPKHKGPLGTWNWIHRTKCEKCPDAVLDNKAREEVV